ncbi:hypothetical protein SDC9_173840 [bioreactor metagenome]|uniref:Uncharacterized protein n=1 Tax=bioreactor metagenome TaxID=1076179 RepID=A0A645GJK6_9ZZZZ
MGGAITVDLNVQSRRQGVDHRGAHAVKTAGGVVGTRPELATGMQLGEHDLDAGQAGARLDVHRNAASDIHHLNRSIGIEADLDPVTEARQRLVHGVVDDLPQAVHQAAGIRRADVHRRTLANRLQALQHQQVPSLVVPAFSGFRRTHARKIISTA